MSSRHLQLCAGTLVLFATIALGGACGGPGVEGSGETEAVPERIVAIGDIHGDLNAARAALRLAGAIDAEDHWIGGDLVVVQTGDILDRGDDEAAIFALFDRLGEEASQSGGAVHIINGNHELMNSYLDYRYVTEGGLTEFEGLGDTEADDSLLATLDPSERVRAAAFRPGGPLALRLAEQAVTVTIGNTLFTHAGILPEHVDLGLDRMEAEVQAWLRDEVPQPEWIRGDRGLVWNRVFSDLPNPDVCDTLDEVLDRLNLQRMVVGHTVQETGITSFCGGRVWCIDVGMAAHYGGRPEVLEIRGDVVRGLRPDPVLY